MKDVEWKAFRIDELFEVSGTVTTHPKHLKQGGRTPRITCAATDNGLDDVYDNTATEDGAVLTIDSATDGIIFYQPYNFIATDHVEKISIKEKQKMTKEIGLFLKTNIEKAKYNKYGYGYKFSQTRIKKQYILLPIDSLGNPNWQFMEEYIKQKEKKQTKMIVEYYKEKLANICRGGGTTSSLKSIKWKAFRIGGDDGIFDIGSTSSGIDKNKLNMASGNVPYITRSEINNGINMFITDDQNMKYKKDEKNTITIGLDTQSVFYQTTEFFTGQNIQVLKNANLNEYNAMFIIPLIKIQMRKFNWGGNGATLSRLNRTNILLPVDNAGNPNWQFMESYIKSIEAKQIEKIIKYLL